jgi:hypothetical protein
VLFSVRQNYVGELAPGERPFDRIEIQRRDDFIRNDHHLGRIRRSPQ